MRTATKYINIYVPGPKNCFFGSWSTHFEWREVFCFGYTQTCWVDDHPLTWKHWWELINPITKQPWGICSTISKKVPKKTNRSPCYFTRTTSPIFHAHTLTHDSRLLMGHVWCDLSLMQFESGNVFISVRLPLSCLALFSAGMRFVPSKSHLTTCRLTNQLMEPYMEVGCSYPSMAGRSNSCGPSMIITPKRNCSATLGSTGHKTSSSYLVTSSPFPTNLRVQEFDSLIQRLTKRNETIMIVWKVLEQDD